MTDVKEIQRLHDRGFVILAAKRANNSPIGWKRKIPGKNKWGYVEEMQDQSLSIYRSTFNAKIIARSHCGFYLGHGNLCCIDLDVKKLKDDSAEKLKSTILKKLSANVVIERTKSQGYHIYFLYEHRLDNRPNWTGLDAKTSNWIEVYYSKRFIACYLSNSKKYTLEHGELTRLKPLSKKQHAELLTCLQPYKGKERKQGKRKEIPVDESTWTQAEAYVKQIETSGLDITGDNPLWFKIGKAFANAFGIKGFSLFNRLSQFSATYNADTIEDEYTRFVDEEAQPRNKKITIATFFKLCDDAGLNSLETLATIAAHPPAQHKEFELMLSKKQRMPEHVHAAVDAFLQHVAICCVDDSAFYVYDSTHWQRRNSKEVVDLINSFVDRSDVEDRFRPILRTVPYLKMMLEELRLVTQRDALEPNTGNLRDGIFINMENGVLHVNLKTGKRKLLDHEAHYNFTTMLPFCYEPTVVSPLFDAWLARQLPDKDLQTAYFAFVASCLTRHKADIIMILAGETSTGKSSLIDITRRLIGLENSVAISAGTLFGGKPDAQTEAMAMENKLLAYDFDSQPFRHLEMLLKVAAGEPIPGWQMHVARRAVVNYGRLLIAMNPYSYSIFNPAVARRLITISMDVKVEKDNAVMPPIYGEVAGIFNYVLNIGIKHLIEHGGQIKITDSMRAATVRHHMHERDAIRWFESTYTKLNASVDKSTKTTAEEKLRKANPDAEIVMIQVSGLYQEYRSWLTDSEGVPESRVQLRKHFVEDLKNYGVVDGIIREKSGLKRGVFVGQKSVTSGG